MPDDETRFSASVPSAGTFKVLRNKKPVMKFEKKTAKSNKLEVGRPRRCGNKGQPRPRNLLRNCQANQKPLKVLCVITTEGQRHW